MLRIILFSFVKITKYFIMKKYFFFLVSICLIVKPLFADVDTLAVYSSSMEREMPAVVVLPDCYPGTDESYPVIYLLHGAYGDYLDWLVKLPDDGVVKTLADKYRVIFVLPEGGTFSFYLDSPWDEGSQYETHITNELIPYVDDHFRTINKPEGRVITGLSMGGQGALYLAARNPHLFGAAGSMSGAVHLDIASWDLPPDDIDRLLQGFLDTMGAEAVESEFLADHSATALVPQMKENGMPLIIDCGVDDFLISANRELNRRLNEYNVPHDYIERPGRHNWPYWQNALLYHVLFFAEFFKSQL